MPIQLWEKVKAISTLILVVVFAVKIYKMEAPQNVDLPTLLSLLLALFSVALSTLFYFKATETSNAFYDNTYKFTKDIAELLVRIESGFGERLKHLDENYTSMQSYIRSVPSRQTDNVEKTKEELKTEKQEIEKVTAERDKIIKELFEKSQIQEEEKNRIKAELENKEKELLKYQSEIQKLDKRLMVEKLQKRKERVLPAMQNEALVHFTLNNVIKKMGRVVVREAPTKFIQLRFKKLLDELPMDYIEDLRNNGFYDEELTNSGINFLREVAHVI